MLRKRKRQDLSSRSGSDSNSSLIAWAEGLTAHLTAPPRQPPPPSCFTQRQLSPFIDKGADEEEKQNLYDDCDGVEGEAGALLPYTTL